MRIKIDKTEEKSENKPPVALPNTPIGLPEKSETGILSDDRVSTFVAPDIIEARVLPQPSHIEQTPDGEDNNCTILDPDIEGLPSNLEGLPQVPVDQNTEEIQVPQVDTQKEDQESIEREKRGQFTQETLDLLAESESSGTLEP